MPHAHRRVSDIFLQMFLVLRHSLDPSFLQNEIPDHEAPHSCRPIEQPGANKGANLFLSVNSLLL